MVSEDSAYLGSAADNTAADVDSRLLQVAERVWQQKALTVKVARLALGPQATENHLDIPAMVDFWYGQEVVLACLAGTGNAMRVAAEMAAVPTSSDMFVTIMESRKLEVVEGMDVHQNRNTGEYRIVEDGKTYQGDLEALQQQGCPHVVEAVHCTAAFKDGHMEMASRTYSYAENGSLVWAEPEYLAEDLDKAEKLVGDWDSELRSAYENDMEFPEDPYDVQARCVSAQMLLVSGACASVLVSSLKGDPPGSEDVVNTLLGDEGMAEFVHSSLGKTAVMFGLAKGLL